MSRHGWAIASLIFALTLHLGSVAHGDDQLAPRGTKPTPLQDDAALHDVTFIGTQTGWAVGDHGVIWKTTDGGMTWDLQASGVTCALRSVTFISAKVGFVAGGQSLPYVHQGQGVVLATTDGGATWQPIGGNNLPELHRVRFFTPMHGVAVGEPGTQCPSGISTTKDGGKTWQPAAGEVSASWRAADFLNPDLGAVAGLRGEHSLFGDGQLIKSKLARFGLRGAYGLKLLAGGEGWLVGDGGLIRHQRRGNIIWEAPATSPPPEARELFDFRTVAVRGTKVWIAGDPGSVIWFSPDSGKSWKRQFTQQTLPLAAIHFSNDEAGWAVGALGTILQTTDGGETWLSVRGADRRVAYMATLSHVDRVSIPLVTTVSGEAGYRGLISVVPRYDVGNLTADAREMDLKLAEATTLAGGSAAVIGWRLPVDIPGLEQNPERLVEEWTKRSEGELQAQLIAQCVRQIRTWRPNVIVVDQPGPRDALAKLILDTVVKAIPDAADPTRQPAQQELANLPTWQVDRVFVRLADGSQGQVNIGGFEPLPRRGCAVAIAAAPAIARLQHDVSIKSVREAYRVTSLEGQAVEYRGFDFFAKLGISPDTDARRALPPTDDQQQLVKIKLAKQQRNFIAMSERMAGDTRQANQMIAMLGRETVGMPDDQAALLIAQLAETYRRHGQWDLAEATLVEMVERFPHEPAAQDAMRWLVQLWVSAELTHHRLQGDTISRERLSIDKNELARRQKTAGQRKPSDSNTLDEAIDLANGKDSALKVEQLPIQLSTGSKQAIRQERITLWQDKARKMASILQRTSPAWYQSPDIQMPLGTLFRQRQLSTDANNCYHFIMQGKEQTPWQKTASTEIWLNQMAGVPPKSIYGCHHTEAPRLDGVLNDKCWQHAEEMKLTSEQVAGPLTKPAFALISHDDEYLYFAVYCPHVAGTPDDVPERTGRSYDADLGANDRVTLMLDADRDYITAFRFTVDQRGWTNDDLWGDVTWNPKWYVAADADEQSWRCEVAIPWKELLPHAPAPGSVWAASVVRTIPAHGVQSWTRPVESRQKLESGGLLKFE